MEEIGGLRRCRDCGCMSLPSNPFQVCIVCLLTMLMIGRLKDNTTKNKKKNKKQNKNKARKVSQQRDLLTGDDGCEFDTSRIYYEVPELKELDEDMKQAGWFEPDVDVDEKVPDDDDRDDDQDDGDQGEGASAGHHHGREDSTDSQDGGILLIEGVVEEEGKDDQNKEETEKEKKPKCRFHPGTVVSKVCHTMSSLSGTLVNIFTDTDCLTSTLPAAIDSSWAKAASSMSRTHHEPTNPANSNKTGHYTQRRR